MLHREDELSSNHMKKWRSYEGYKKFIQMVEKFVDVDSSDEICKRNYVNALIGGENKEEKEVIQNVKEAAYQTAQVLILQEKKTNAFDNFVFQPQPSRQGTISESNRSSRSELATTQTLSGSVSFHNQYINQMKRFRRES